MMFNDVQFDMPTCLHNIALEHAKRDLASAVADGIIKAEDTARCLDTMFDAYVQAFAYLSQKSDGYIKSLAEHP